jgi:hypothetical protein
MSPPRLVMVMGAATTGTIVYRTILRPRHQRWGATVDEAAEQLPGDDEVANPSYVATRAIAIDVNGHSVLPAGGHGTSPAADSSSPQPRT